MKVFGFTIGRASQAVSQAVQRMEQQTTQPTQEKLTTVGASTVGSQWWSSGGLWGDGGGLNSFGGGFWGKIKESFSGAWQRNVEIDGPATLLAFSAVFACVTGIAADVGKLPPKVIELNDGIWEQVSDSKIDKLLNRPNHYQNRIKFLEQWVISKLLAGNTYVLKRRDENGEVDALYILDPRRVKIVISTDGDVFYQLSLDPLVGIEEGDVAVPASEIIHDQMVALWHPLIGVSPIYACAMSATMGNRIQVNSQIFFNNASRPSGVLTAPGAISNETAQRLKEAWENNFTGGKIGKLAVLGDNLKYDPMTIPAVEAQLIEQLKWTVEDVARAFHYPLYKLGGAPPSYNNIEALGQMYYSDCLQPIIESLELCLDIGLDMPAKRGIELDLDNLLRMDSVTRYERNNKAIAGGWLSPNEARKKENMKPAEGGDEPFMQQQNYPLSALASADRPPPGADNGGGSNNSSAPVAPAPAGGEPTKAMDDKAADEFLAQVKEGFGKLKMEIASV